MILKLQWLLIGFHFKAYHFVIFKTLRKREVSMEEIPLNSNVDSFKNEDL